MKQIIKKQFTFKLVRDDNVTIEMNLETLELRRVVQNFQDFLNACGFNIGNEVELTFSPTNRLKETTLEPVATINLDGISLQPLDKHKMMSNQIIHPTIPTEGFQARSL